MRVGVPAEVKNNESRVALTPAGANELVRAGHEVILQAGAGAGSHLPDEEYLAVGATIGTADDAWGAELVLKVKEPIASEYRHLREDLTVFTYLHLAADELLADALLETRTTSLAYETVQLPDRSLPLLAPMSEVAGRLSTLVGAYHLMGPHGGRGILLGGVPGVRPARVTVLGGGVAGWHAVDQAVGLGANVTVIDVSVPRLRHFDNIFGGRVSTVASSAYEIERSVLESDLVIGSVLVPGERAPKLVTLDLVARMKPGSVLVDVAIDQGGCFEGSRPTARRANVHRGEHAVLLRGKHAGGGGDHVDSCSHQRNAAVRAGARRARVAGRSGGGSGAREGAHHGGRGDRLSGCGERVPGQARGCWLSDSANSSFGARVGY